MTHRLPHTVLSLALAAAVTLGLLASLDGLASHEASSGIAAQMAATQSSAPRAG